MCVLFSGVVVVLFFSSLPSVSCVALAVCPEVISVNACDRHDRMHAQHDLGKGVCQTFVCYNSMLASLEPAIRRGISPNQKVSLLLLFFISKQKTRFVYCICLLCC